MNWKENRRKCLCPNLKSRHMPGRTGESYVNLKQDNWFSDRDLDPRLPTQFRNPVTRIMLSEAVISGINVRVNLSLCVMK
jgi:hypothetical protein